MKYEPDMEDRMLLMRNLAMTGLIICSQLTSSGMECVTSLHDSKAVCQRHVWLKYCSEVTTVLIVHT